MSATTRSVLQRYWGYPSFRPFQEDIVDSVVAGRDTLALLPTGGGKSICFQVPAMAMDGVCIVVTPLIALMKDQVMHLLEKDIAAAAIYSGLYPGEVEHIYNKAVFGNLKFLYVSPERLQTQRFIEAVKRMKVCLLAVDEAHCISQWGYDFRPPYLLIAQLREYIRETPVLALTATATARVVDDIQARLGFAKKNVFQSSFARPNVTYSVMHEPDKMNVLRTRLQTMGEGSAIVYVRSRKRTQIIAEWLSVTGISATFYHAGLDAKQRDQRQNLWMRGDVKVMVATNAFGMGIDKPDVRLVLHLDLPDSLEAYFQEAGRAGRDLKESNALLIVSKADVAKLYENLQQSYPEPKRIQLVYQALGTYLNLNIGSGEGEVFPFMLDNFSSSFGFSMIEAFSALKILEKEGFVTLSEALVEPSKVMVKASRDEIYDFQLSNPRFEPLVNYMLRNMPGVMTDFVKLNEESVARKLSISVDELEQQLRTLERQNFLTYAQRSDKPTISLATDYIGPKAVVLSRENYYDRKKEAQERVKAVTDFVNNDSECRSVQLLRYFNEEAKNTCGKCDVCVKSHKHKTVEYKNISSAIMGRLGESPMSYNDALKECSSFEPEDVMETLRWMIDNGVVKSDNDTIHK